MKNQIILFLFFWVSSLMGGAKVKFTDQQIASMVPKVFVRDHNAPKITRIRIYAENGEKIFHLEIEVNRSRYEGQMDYTIAAMANLAQYAKKPFDKLKVILHPMRRGVDSELVEANAKCSINYFIRKKMNYDRWIKYCLTITPI
jgi:hypothetical protein